MATERSSALPTQGGFLERGGVLFCQAGLKRALLARKSESGLSPVPRAGSCSALAGFGLNSRYRVRGSWEQSFCPFRSQKGFLIRRLPSEQEILGLSPSMGLFFFFFSASRPNPLGRNFFL